MKLSQLQHDILDYLIRDEGDSGKRWTALKDLRNRGLFEIERSDENVTMMVNDYLDSSGTFFCEEGVRRFRTALHIEPPKPAEEIHVVLKFKVDGELSSFNRFHLAEKMLGLFNAAEKSGGRYISRCFDKESREFENEWGSQKATVRYDGAQLITGVGTPQEQKQTIVRDG